MIPYTNTKTLIIQYDNAAVAISSKEEKYVHHRQKHEAEDDEPHPR